MRITASIMIACFALFLLQIFYEPFTGLAALTPAMAVNGMYWQFFTYMFLHGSISHLAINMIGLFIFGAVVEKLIGVRRYLFLYIASGLGAGAFHILLTGISDVPMLGASGAVFAVLTAYAVKFPKNWIIVFPGIPVPAALLVVFFAFFEFFSGMLGFEPGIANFGHLGGILFGFIFMFYWEKISKNKHEPESFQWVWETW